MKILSIVLVCGLMISLFLTAEKPATEVIVNDGKQHQLTVKLNQVNSKLKSVLVYVYDEQEKRVFSKTVSASEALKPIVFADIETGRYAVYVQQNTDDDPELKMDSNGIPLEPIGYANNPILMGPPIFNDVSINIKQDTQVSINLISYG